MNYEIRLAETEQEISGCFPVIRELRPHLKEDSYRSQVKRQRTEGYRLVFLESGGEVRAVAGFRVSENLAWGRFLYVDDLVTRDCDRSLGFGSRLFDWLVQEAARQGCGQLHLDSGVQRFNAHRFYLHKDLRITSHHFALELVPPSAAEGRRKGTLP